MKLPTQRKKPSDNIVDYILMIVGEKKVGKTSFCTQFPNNFIMEFEPGNAKHLDANYEDITSLSVFNSLLRELENNPGYCKTLILDEITILYDLIHLALLALEGIEDPQKLGHGKGWGRIGRTFDSYIRRLQSLDCGIIYTGHSEIKEAESRSGRKISKLEAAMGSRVSRTMDRLTHFWGVMQFNEEGNRNLHITGDDYIKAGHGFSENHFKLVEGGVIPLGSSPVEGYQNFIKAWNNEPLNNSLGKRTTKKKGLRIGNRK